LIGDGGGCDDVVVAIHDNHHSIKDMTLLDYFTICQMRNNVYIHPIEDALSSKVKNHTFPLIHPPFIGLSPLIVTTELSVKTPVNKQST
jgi:hypothetical protein